MMADKPLEGKVAIVTGGAGGIGRVLVRALEADGAKVAVVDVDEAAMRRLGEALAEGPADGVITLAADVSDPEACEATVARVVETLGGVHILVNNAAVGMGLVRADHFTRLVDIQEITPALWQRFVNTNFCGAWYMTRFAAPHLLAQGWGRIIDVSTSFFTMLRGGFHPYGPVKAGLEAMAAGHAAEFAGTGVTVNVVVPGGPTDTPMVPPVSGLKREALIPPRVMAPPVLWLCSAAADDVTGNRYVGADWDASLPPEAAARGCAAPIAWPQLATSPVWPGGRPED